MLVTYYIKLFRVGADQTQQYFNVSTPCFLSHRDNNQNDENAILKLAH